MEELISLVPYALIIWKNPHGESSKLVNGRFGGPGLLVDLVHEGPLFLKGSVVT